MFGAMSAPDGFNDELEWVWFEGVEGMGDGVHRFDDRIGVDWRYGGGGRIKLNASVRVCVVWCDNAPWRRGALR